MGCSQSKTVAAPTAAPAAPTATKKPPSKDKDAPLVAPAEPTTPVRLKNANGLQRVHSSGALSSSSSRRGRLREDVISPRTPDRVKVNGTLKASDGHWESLYMSLPPPVDPADVPSVIADLMARQINMLNPTEITYLQRRIRFLVKSLTNQTMIGRFRSEPTTESKTLVEKFQLLDERILRKLWVDNELVGSAVVLLTHFSEQSWRRAATIAQETAENAGLVVDVNKKKSAEDFIPPLPPASVSSTEETAPEGVTFSSVCFLISLALRGTRLQRLQLLFYLLVKPATLNSFLNSHPAGGVPTWLLEVDNDVVISLPSMTHYYYFGSAFLPRRFDTVGVAEKEPLKVSSVMERVHNMLRRSTENNYSPDRRGNRQRRNGGEVSDSNFRHRRHSEASDTSYGGDNDEMGLEFLQQEPDLEHFHVACESFQDGDWTMDDFLLWANHAVDDNTLDALMYRAFASDVLPTPFGERSLVLQRWQQWQQSDIKLWALEDDSHGYLDYISQSFSNFCNAERRNDEAPAISRIWGYLGGFDGRGGLGHGMMYCVDMQWWDEWEDYVGWNWEADIHSQRRTRIRPSAIPTELLLDHSSEAVVAGTLGSYEVMKMGLVKGVDYVLVPPGVWDVLYELYGGGPPLPRIVLPPPKMEKERTFSVDSKQMEEEDIMQMDSNVEVVPNNSRLLRVPDALVVATHPWVFNCHVCDAQQPYRRGDAGPFSIRIMATPDQPLSRLYAEIIVRLPIHNAKAMDKDGRGQARLWREIEPSAPKDPSSRFGPWSLLCKNRSAILPVTNLALEFEENYVELKRNWRAYADHATVEGIGLVNGDRIMLEYAVQNKAGRFIWPREAAAKASRMRRLADDDLKFRRLLRGVDENDKVVSPPPELLGMMIDAMDVSGRWFQVEILQVQIVSDEEEDTEANEDGEEPEDNSKKADKQTERKQIRVDFTECGGHEEWIDIDSDRLATAGRFTQGTTEDDETEATSTNLKNGNEAKPKPGAPSKKATNDVADQNAGKICTLPSYGACGLANLGNTCYVNSAIQCISYMPLLRAYLLSAQYKATGDLNKDNPLGTGGKLLEEFADLLRVMWSGKYGERSPTRFRGHLGKARPQFSAADQQDAQEFLNYLLDVLHEDSNKIKDKPTVEGLEDDWVKENSLPRVGEEAWRRFLRRNRSVMADVAMGQVLNTVTCPVCMFSSRNFDPFNILSIPFPTVADVVFVCTVIRRGTALNSPRVLNRPRKGEKKSRFERKKLRDARSLSDNLVVEQYAIAMSRLADIGDLKLRLQNICGISAKRLKLCKLEEVVATEDADDSSPVKTYMKVTAQPDKEGPCSTVAKSGKSSDEVEATSSSPTKIIAFEMTLRPRPTPSSENGISVQAETEDSRVSDDSSTVDEEDDSTHNGSRAYTQRERRLVKEQLQFYGDKKECRLLDTDPLPLSKAISRSLWPSSDKEFKLGLRVDAIDHRDHWFPGSIVEIIEGVQGVASEHGDEEKSEHPTKTKVRIHFDNFSSKWDETYTIDHFKRGQVRPLYSHATPRVKPTEFLVYHRYLDRSTKANVLFGQTFFLQCENEWSTARAGAHILAQASRFLHRPEVSSNGPVDVDEVNDNGLVQRLYDRVQATISDLIDLLVECDLAYVRSSLGISEDGKDLTDDTYRNPDFDATELSTELVKKAGALLHRLPFEVRVCMAEASLVSGKAEEVSFPFSLMRAIGNFMNARHVVVLHWHDPPVDKKHSSRAVLNAPVMYTVPQVAVHKSTTDLLSESKAHASKNNPGSGGMHLSVCLKEFCKTQKLDLSDSWRCPRCKDFREGNQHMDLWRLPDLLTFHIKRFNCSARWHEKITTKVNFPLTGLDMREWCHSESPSTESNVYDLIGVMNHYGGMTGGHYVALCKATACGPEGSEEVAYSFPGAGTNLPSVVDETDRTGWRLGVTRKEKEMNQSKVAAAAATKYVSESSEPLWLQFDDELVEPIPPRNVVSEMAYVLFYRRRQLTSANIAKYSTLE